MEATRILGIDPGFGRMGFGCIETDRSGQIRVLDYGVITTSSQQTFSERLSDIAVDLRALLTLYKPHLVAMEQLYFAKNVTTGLRVAEARGVVRLLAAEQGVPIQEHSPSQIKKALTGHGGAKKQAMQQMIQRMLRLPSLPQPDDAADALAVAFITSTHSRMFG